MGLPIHHWVRATTETEAFLGFTYVDRTAGPSLKGVRLAAEAEPSAGQVREAIHRPSQTCRLRGMTVTALAAADVARLELPAKPPWLAIYADLTDVRPYVLDEDAAGDAAVGARPPASEGLQPAPARTEEQPAEATRASRTGAESTAASTAGGAMTAATASTTAVASAAPVPPWRADPVLHGRFHPQYHDDIQATFLFPEQRQVESIWVRVTGVDAEVGGYVGQMLNTPQTSSELKAGARVTIRMAPGAHAPVHVSPVMRANLARCTARCATCGFDMVVLPLEALIRRSFPDLPPGGTMSAFTTRCALCNQTMTVEMPEAGNAPADAAPAADAGAHADASSAEEHRDSSASLPVPRPDRLLWVGAALVIIAVVLGIVLGGRTP